MPSILIIDDEEPIAWALRRAFEREKYRVGVAATAEDGLAQARKNQPDIVFLDVRLPGMDGLTALAELRKIAPNAAVIIITAHGNLNTAVKAVEGGAYDYLAKPFDLAQALEAAKRALTRARRKLLVIGDSATLANHPFYQRMLTYFESIGAYSSVWEEAE